METKKITNRRIIDLMSILSDNSPNALIRRSLPYKVVYALHRTSPKIKDAYEACIETLDNLCKQYGTTRQVMRAKDRKKNTEFQELVEELMKTETEVEVYGFDQSIMDNYDESRFTTLSFVELEALYLFARETKEETKEKTKEEKKEESEEK